jgi:hypothetical protein
MSAPDSTANLSGRAAEPDKPWPKATPESVGMDPSAIAAFDADLASGKYPLCRQHADHSLREKCV